MRSLARFKLPLLIGVGIALTLLIARFLTDEIRDDPFADLCPVEGRPECDADFSAFGSAEEALAARYAPILYIRQQKHECDTAGGQFNPKPVEIVLGNLEVALRGGDRNLLMQGASASDLFSAPAGAFLDLPGDPRRPGCLYIRDGHRYAQDQRDVAYAHVAREDGEDQLALQYWFFYYFDDFNSNHEGDWEMIQLTFDAPDAAAALTMTPDHLAYSQHRGGELATWSDEKLEREGTRPIVYVAVGSQANFFQPHLYIGRAGQGEGLGCDNTTAPSRRVEVEPRLLPSDVASADDANAWVAYRGRWGQLAGPEFDGPTGPITKWQWRSPISWAEGLRSSSVKVPGSTLAGPNAVGAFCDVVEFASGLFLPIILELPWLAAAAAASAILGLLFACTRTRYIPVQSTPLRGRRRMGQVLTSAFDIYLRSPWLFLSIGLVFIPVGMLASLAHGFTLRISPVEPVVPFPEANIAQEVVLILAVGQLHFGLAYALVIAGTTAALAAMEIDRLTSVRQAFATVMRRFGALFLSRFVAFLVVMGLAITVIGLPLALRQAVRWAFLEQAVLLDGKEARPAFAESASAAGADWWWSAGAIVALGLVGLAVAPALGIFLVIFLRSTPVAYVNLIASAIYVAIVPYVAIALALVYFDLRSRATRASVG